MKLILQVGILSVFLSLHQISGKPSWRDVGRCGSNLACGPKCQKLCLTQHNYYRALHNLPPVRCDPDLAESAQAWTDMQAQKGHLKRSPWRNLGQVAESISWKQWGWEGMAETRAAVPSAVRSWYSEMKGSIVNRTVAPEHYQTIVRPDITRLGCGIHVIPGDGTYVTSHYGTAPGGQVLNDEIHIPTAKDPEPTCQIKSGQREKCGNISSPYVTPDVCLKAGCCYDDVFRDEPDVNWYSTEGSTWCYKGKKHDTANKTPMTNNIETQSFDNNEASANTLTDNLKNQTSLEDNGEPKGFFKDCLDQHNKLRAKHGVPPLKWSKKLADNALRVAKMNANLGRMKHDPTNTNEGENIAYFGPPQPKCEGAKDGKCFQCREVVDDWYSEIKDYDFGRGKSKNGGVVLHFTQVVWRATTEMGMATAVGNNKVFSVARYAEKGNMLPEDNFVKNVPPLGSGLSPTSQPGSTVAGTSPTPQPPTGAITFSTTGASATPDMESEAGNDCYGNSCYSFNGEGKKWTENREECKKKGGDLVSIETDGEWTFLKDKIQGLSNPLRDEWHIGLKKEGSTWNWVNGDPLTITRWQRGQPSGDGPYVVMAKNYPPGTKGLLNDLPDRIPSGYICETKKSETNTSPTVPSGISTPTPQPSTGAVTSAATAVTAGATSGATAGFTTGALTGSKPTSGATTAAASGGGQTEEWMKVGSCGQGLTCGPDCQLLCLKLHNYYRKLHNAPPMSCDPKLAMSAQNWTDEQARVGRMHHSSWTDKFTESISWKGWGWEGMEKMEGAIPGATRGWYSEIKNDYNYATGKGNGQAVGHFMAVVWKGETKLGCGLNIKPGKGTYVTAHYAPASHANSNYYDLAPKNVLPRKDPEPECDLRSSERKDCNANLKAPFVTPEECLNAGCCYDDMFMSEPGVKFYGAEGRKWCFVPKGGVRPAPTKAPGGATTGTPGVTMASGGAPTGTPGVTMASGGKPTGTPGVTEAPGGSPTGEPKGFFKDCLDQHNKLRAKHGVPPLKWSKKLADNALRVAKMNANLGRMKHDPTNTNEGENIAYFGPPQPKCEGAKDGKCFQCREVVDDWYSEIKDYDFGRGKSKNGGVVLHFTQVVWRATTEMGMATAVGNNKVFSVARYAEKGNMLPEDNFVKNVPPLV